MWDCYGSFNLRGLHWNGVPRRSSLFRVIRFDHLIPAPFEWTRRREVDDEDGYRIVSN